MLTSVGFLFYKSLVVTIIMCTFDTIIQLSNQNKVLRYENKTTITIGMLSADDDGGKQECEFT